MSAPPPAPPSPPPPSASAPGSSRLAGLPTAGEILAGKYMVEAVLGVGGMAVVVAARHLDLDERVALKILLPKYRTNEEIVARFRREARAAVKIKSEHVARVHDVGTLEDGAPCLVMEYLDGLDLESLLDDLGRIDRRDAVDYILEACEALAEAHSLGVVHRDLKPANLFLAQRADGTSSIKLLDFGISKVAGAGRGLTRKRSSFGTPHYMSPEQLRATEDVDARADVWAMGAILQELITGHPPFDSDDLTELQALIKTGAPVPLRERVPDAPSGLEAVVLRCLAKEPEQRVQSVAEMALALAPFGSPRAVALAEGVLRVAEATRNRAAVVDAAMQRPPTPIAFSPAVTPPAPRSDPSSVKPPATSSGRPIADLMKMSTKTSITVDGSADDTGTLTETTRLRGRAAMVVGALAAVPLLVAAFYGAGAWRRGHPAAAPPELASGTNLAPLAAVVAVSAVPAATPVADEPVDTKPVDAKATTADAGVTASPLPDGPSAGAATKPKPPTRKPLAKAASGKSGDRLFDDRK